MVHHGVDLERFKLSNDSGGKSKTQPKLLAFGQKRRIRQKLKATVMRKVVAIPAAAGLIVGMYIFVASFLGLTMDKLGRRAFLLHLGVLAIGIP
jgi:hypothetical protein